MRWMFALMIMLPLAAHGTPLSDDGVSAPEMAAALKDAGYPADVTNDRSGDPMIRSSNGKRLFNVYFYQCGRQLRCASIQFTAPFPRKGIPADAIAAWNRERRFGRAFQDASGTTWLAMDVEAGHGMTTEALIGNIERWILVLSAFDATLVPLNTARTTR